MKTDRILDAGAPQFAADAAFHSALVNDGFVIGYLRYGEFPQHDGLTPSGVVELYLFPSDSSATRFTNTLGASFTAGGETLTETSVVPGGREYAFRTAGVNQSVTVLGMRNHVAFQVTLSGTTGLAPAVEHLATLQYDRL